MTELFDTITKEFFSKYGPFSIVAGYLIYDRWTEWKEDRKQEQELKRKKESGEYISWKDLQTTLEMQGRHISKIESLLDEHLEKEKQEDIMIGKLQTNHENLKEKVESENTHVFSQLKSLHDKFDALTRILLEQRKA